MIILIDKILTLLFLFFCTVYAVEIKTISEAIDIAGKQRMYTQRLLRDYAMIGMRNNFSNPKNDMEHIIQAFEDHLYSLDLFSKDAATKQKISDVKSRWETIKRLLVKSPNTSDAAILQNELEKLLKSSDEITKLFTAQSKSSTGEIINIAGRQRMLSQRMASLYMLKAWGIDDPQFKKKLSDAMRLFRTSLEKLLTFEKNSPEITTILKRVKRDFMFFEIMGRSSKKFIPALIYKKSNEILKNMNSATKLYTKLNTN
jgi:nitrate/nitrite-specific signal transduction histidine kinase